MPAAANPAISPPSSSSSSSSSSDSEYRREIDAAIRRGKEKRGRGEGGTATAEKASSSSSSSSSSQRRRQQQQQQQQQTQPRRQSSNRDGGGGGGVVVVGGGGGGVGGKVPNSPRSTELYRRMEADIERLRTDYEGSRIRRRRRRRRRVTPDGANNDDEGESDDDDDDDDERETDEDGDWPSPRILAALRYADYLRHRDATIHDGGTHQAEAIDVYRRAIRALEGAWRRRMAGGEDVRFQEEGGEDSPSSSSSSSSSSYAGLNRELFLDHDAKSVEGSLCAAHTGLGKTYFMSNMFELAVESYEGCLSLDPTYLDSLVYRAQALLILGRYDEAGGDYVRTLGADPRRLFADAVTGLAKVLVAKEDAVPGGWDTLVRLLDGEIPTRTEMYERTRSSSRTSNGGAAAEFTGAIKHHADALRRMHHAMFAYHDVKTLDASEAWRHLSRGNEYKLSTVPPYNAEAEGERVRRVKGVFQQNFFPPGIGSRTLSPIFVIGFVRSGSTLLERILDAHPLIVGTGEDSVFNGRLDAIRNEIVSASIGGDLGVLHETVRRLADEVVRDMKSRWEAIDATTNNNMRDGHDQDDDGRGGATRPPYPTRFADKMLTNYMNVGFIHLLFPNALILHVAREPMDTIFSAFKHDFPPGVRTCPSRSFPQHLSSQIQIFCICLIIHIDSTGVGLHVRVRGTRGAVPFLQRRNATLGRGVSSKS